MRFSIKSFFASAGIYYVLLIALAIPPLFFGLGQLPIRVFDEARNIITAIEMSESGNLLVSTYHHEPEMWSSKPPFFTWCMAACIKMFGLSEFSVRIPSALAALACVLLVLHFVRKQGESTATAFMAAMMLLTAQGFAHDHTARTADYDVMMLMWSLLGGILFYRWNQRHEQRDLNLGFLCFALATLTKSAAAFLSIPGIGIFLLIQKESRMKMLSLSFFRSALWYLIPVLGFYLGRESVNPGYLKAVWENEFGGRYFIPLDAHEHGFWYYAENLVNGRMSLWLWPALAAWLMIPFIKEKSSKMLLFYSFLLSISVFMIISTAGTKLFWYDLPMYPWLVISAAVFVKEVIGLFSYQLFKIKLNNIKMMIVYSFMIFYPYLQLIQRNVSPKEKPEERGFYSLSHYLKKISSDRRQQDFFYLYYTYAEFFYEFYLYVNPHKEFSIVKEPGFKKGDLVFHHVPATGRIMDSLYTYETTLKLGDYHQVRISSVKN